jgi:hypothetical protein
VPISLTIAGEVLWQTVRGFGLPCWISPSGSSIIGRGRTSTRRRRPEDEERWEGRISGGGVRGVDEGVFFFHPMPSFAWCCEALGGLGLLRATSGGGAEGRKSWWRCLRRRQWERGCRKCEGLVFRSVDVGSTMTRRSDLKGTLWLLHRRDDALAGSTMGGLPARENLLTVVLPPATRYCAVVLLPGMPRG